MDQLRELDPGADLDPEQRAAVQAPRGPVCVLAGAGTGKTRTITHRIAALVRAGQVAPGAVLAVTFTARAAGQMRTRLRALGADGVQARTFHAAALRQLRYFWPQVIGDEPWPLAEQKLRLIGQAAQRVEAPTDGDTLRDLAGEIEWAKASLVSPDGYPAATARRDPPLPAAQVGKAYTAYEELKNRARVLDFDDLLLHTAAAVEEHPAVAQEFRERYRCFVVDEYQDVTPAQQRLLDAWLGERDDLTVVGDVNQTIYSFAGAAPDFLLGFTRRFPDAALVRLVRDYRSSPQVVSLANRTIAGARHRPPGSRLRLTGVAGDGPEPRFAEHDDEPAEAAAVAEAIDDLLADGVAAGEIAVLYRVNAQSEAYEQALDARGIPFQVRGGERFFRRGEVRAAMRALRAAAASGADLVTRVREILAGQGLSSEPPGGSTARARWESLRALAELAEELAATVPDADLPRFVAELDARADAAHPPAVQGVTLASLHAAKGLEWDAVFLVGLAEGTVPIQYALSGPTASGSALEEERRLLYVGVTRARRWLTLSWALARSPGGRRRRRSRFLSGLVPDQRRPTRPPTAKPGGDPVLRARLREWRTEQAREQKVPAFVVFSDATLDAIAEQRPVDSAGLVAIPGIGATKLERYGADVLALVRDSLTGS